MCLYPNYVEIYLAAVVLPAQDGPVIARYLIDVWSCFSNGKSTSIALLLFVSKK